jgi:hypothetical protein
MLDLQDKPEAEAPLLVSLPSRRELIEDALRTDPQRSDRQIAREVGCDHKTVGSARIRLGIASPLGNSPPTPTEQRQMLIAAGEHFDKLYPSASGETAEEAVDNAIAKGIVNLGGKCPPPPGVVDAPKYDPFDPKHGDLVIPHQPAIAVYENTAGSIVIRQVASAYGEDDPILRKVAAEAGR